ncbi:hypothetical protein RB195_013088 [Necator americanus]|uniref:Uncharacterized protein n=1 Tax=Necator americanus TaxID=51031 RepID=A0ABR1DTX8_NECAM
MRQRGAAKPEGIKNSRPDSQEVFPSDVRHAIMWIRNRTAHGPDNKTRTPDEPSASTHQHAGETLYTLPVGMQGS